MMRFQLWKMWHQASTELKAGRRNLLGCFPKNPLRNFVQAMWLSPSFTSASLTLTGPVWCTQWSCKFDAENVVAGFGQPAPSRQNFWHLSSLFQLILPKTSNMLDLDHVWLAADCALGWKHQESEESRARQPPIRRRCLLQAVWS